MVSFLLIVCICVNAFGCAGARTSGYANGPDTEDRQNLETEVESSPQEKSSQAPTAATSLEPPGSTLSYDGETVEAGLGGYCWTTDRAASCVDAVGISLGGGRLTVPSGMPLSFEYEGRELDSLGVTAYEIGLGNSNRIKHDILVPPYTGVGKEDRPKVSRSGNRASITARLPAGEYVFDVRAGMPEGGASYGFRLVVEPEDTAAGAAPAFATVRFEPAVPVGEVRRVAAEHDVEGGMIEGEYRIGDEVHTWGSTQGLGTNFEKEQLASFADMVGTAEQMSPRDRKELGPEASSMKDALENDDAGVMKISSIEFYGPVSTLEQLLREEDALISKANVTTEEEMRDMLKNLPKGCCN